MGKKQNGAEDGKMAGKGFLDFVACLRKIASEKGKYKYVNLSRKNITHTDYE